MKVSHHDRQANARRVDQALHSRKAAGDVFRRRHIDLALKRILKNCEQKEINPNPPSADTEAGETS